MIGLSSGLVWSGLCLYHRSDDTMSVSSFYVIGFSPPFFVFINTERLSSLGGCVCDRRTASFTLCRVVSCRIALHRIVFPFKTQGPTRRCQHKDRSLCSSFPFSAPPCLVRLFTHLCCCCCCCSVAHAYRKRRHSNSAVCKQGSSPFIHPSSIDMDMDAEVYC